jgi:hypothetical protein
MWTRNKFFQLICRIAALFFLLNYICRFRVSPQPPRRSPPPIPSSSQLYHVSTYLSPSTHQISSQSTMALLSSV